MRLVKIGKKGEKKWKGTCTGCGAKFEAKEKELNVTYDRDGSLAQEDCTQCGQTVNFYAADGSSSRSNYTGDH